jgi:predicted RNase H-like HicB family nuclease
MHSYLAMIRSLEPGRFLVEYPDLPGCAATTGNFQDARRLASVLLSDHIRHLLSQGVAPPTPRSMRELQDSGATEGAFPSLIPVLEA